jgi:hypothetical protein
MTRKGSHLEGSLLWKKGEDPETHSTRNLLSKAGGRKALSTPLDARTAQAKVYESWHVPQIIWNRYVVLSEELLQHSV